MTAYIWLLRLRGKVIRLYDPLEVVSTDAASKTLYGDRALSLAFPYLNNIHGVDAFSTGLLARLKDPHSSVDSLEFVADKDDTLMAAAMACDVGQRITLSETVTGITVHDYAIGTYGLILEPGKLTCKLGNLERSEVWDDIGTWEETPSDDDIAAYDAVTNVSSDAATGRSFSETHTPVGDPSLIVVGLAIDGESPSELACTYGGTPMVYVGKQQADTSDQWIALFYQLAPVNGAQTVAGSWASSDPNKYKVTCVSVTGATTYNTFLSASQNGATPTATVDINGRANGIVVAFVTGDEYLGADTLGAGQVEFVDDQTEAPQLLGSYELQTTDSTVTMSWSFATTGETAHWAIIAASFYTA